jgi:hypothetical protein
VVAHTVLRTPDDGRKEHPKHVEKSCSEIKYRLVSAASRWKLIYIRLVMQGTMYVKFTLKTGKNNGYCNRTTIDDNTSPNSSDNETCF